MNKHDHEGHQSCRAHHQVHEGAATAPRQATDPVCGMTVDPAKALSHEYDGHTHYRCSEHCRTKFHADPRKYLAASAARASNGHTHHHGHHNHAVPATAAIRQPAAQGKVTYTCPMHPEIVRDAPGACPICGMALEPPEPILDEGANPELVSMTRRFWIGTALTLPILGVSGLTCVLHTGLGCCTRGTG